MAHDGPGAGEEGAVALAGESRVENPVELRAREVHAEGPLRVGGRVAGAGIELGVEAEVCDGLVVDVAGVVDRDDELLGRVVDRWGHPELEVKSIAKLSVPLRSTFCVVV